ncbi:MAG: hypothetical protein K0R12_1162 [Gammaproteobacteria bacterium]|jgi:SAM-dependent methyltransferase|nr:hypothetical protein [Gammaproteobacteria bacterium]
MCLTPWYQQPIGERVYQAEAGFLQSVLPRAFGYYLLQIGCIDERHWLQTSPISRQILLETQANLQSSFKHGTAPSLLAEYEALPFASESIDVVLIAHALEFSKDPAGLLNEVYRCLIPEGKVFILCFNSASLWGLYRCRKNKMPPWTGRFIRPAVLRRQLKEAGFNLAKVSSVMQRPPVKREGIFNSLRCLEWIGKYCWPEKAGCYAMSATKEIEVLTPLRPVWCETKQSLAKALSSTRTYLSHEKMKIDDHNP